MSLHLLCSRPRSSSERPAGPGWHTELTAGPLLPLTFSNPEWKQQGTWGESEHRRSRCPHSRALGATLCRKGAEQHLGVQPQDARSTQACLSRHQGLVCSVPGLHCPTSFNLNVLFLKHVSDKAGRKTSRGMLHEWYLLTPLPILSSFLSGHWFLPTRSLGRGRRKAVL